MTHLDEVDPSELDYNYTTPNILDEMLQRQESCQVSLPTGPLRGLLSDGQIKRAVKAAFLNVYALEDELHELLSETSWKPWAKGDRFDLEAARGEFIDAWHFMLNLANLLELTSRDIQDRYHAKLEKNRKRQEEGYDGVTTKCPGCGRALDDEAVHCYRFRGRLGTDQVEDLVFCDRHGRAYRPAAAP